MKSGSRLTLSTQYAGCPIVRPFGGERSKEMRVRESNNTSFDCSVSTLSRNFKNQYLRCPNLNALDGFTQFSLHPAVHTSDWSCIKDLISKQQHLSTSLTKPTMGKSADLNRAGGTSGGLCRVSIYSGALGRMH